MTILETHPAILALVKSLLARFETGYTAAGSENLIISQLHVSEVMSCARLLQLSTADLISAASTVIDQTVCRA